MLNIVPGGIAPNLGAFGETAADAAPVVTPRIVLHTPDLYVDAIRDTPLVIRWDSYGNTASSPIRIDLYQDGTNGPAFLETIAAARRTRAASSGRRRTAT